MLPSLVASLPHVLIAFGVSFLATFLLARAAPALGLMDHPGGRKTHARPVPVVGGLGIYLALATTALLLGRTAIEIAACASLLVVVGAMDDRLEVSPYARFAAQVAAATLMIMVGSTQLHDVGNLLGYGVIGLWVVGFAMTVFAVVGVINSLNMLDGMDGLVGSVAAIALLWYAAAAYVQGQTGLFVVAGCTAAAVCAFLLFNLRLPWQQHARVFLGDAGSMLLGFVLAWMAVGLTQGPETSLPPIAALWIILLPLADCVSIMSRRLRQGRSPFAPDRRHIHHYLLARGLSASSTLAVLVATSLAFGAVGFFGWRLGIPQHYLFWSFFFGFFGYHFWIKQAWKRLESQQTSAPLKDVSQDEDVQPAA